MPTIVLSIVRALAGVSLLGLVIAVLTAVTVRYAGLFGGSLHWIDEMARFSMIWLAMLGSFIALHVGGHMAVELIPPSVPAMMRRVVQATATLLTFVFLAVLTWQGLRLTVHTMGQFSPALGLPMGAVYLAVPVGGALMCWLVAASALRAVIGWRKDQVGQTGNSAGR